MSMLKRVFSGILALVLLLSCAPAWTAAATAAEIDEAPITTEAPTEEPTEAPTEEPTEAPTEEPAEAPTEEPTEAPTEEPTEAPTEEPTEAPAEEPTELIETVEATAAQEAVNATTSGTCGDDLTWTFDDSTGTLTISGTGEMGDYIHSNRPWGSVLSEIKSVVIQAGVTSIGEYAFDVCSSLTSIAIPDSVTSIGDAAFSSCAALTSITIPDSVTSIGDILFWGCDSLTSITIPNGITHIGKYTFYSCDNLTSITIPDSVTSIGENAFARCSSLTSITIPDGVTSIGEWAFDSCSSLTSINIPDGITSIEKEAFAGCSSLTSITIPDGVTSIGSGAFAHCSSLTDITIPDGVTSIGSVAFWRCTALTSITIPDGVTSIENGTFSDCSITSFTIPAGVTSIGDGAFDGCSNLTSITIPDSVTSIGNEAFWDCTALTSITIPDGITRIGESTFRRCGLTSITIPAGVTSIGKYALAGCSSLTSITFQGDAPQIEGQAFSSVTTTAYYPSGNSTWTADVMQNYGVGTITWVPYVQTTPGDTKIVNVATGVQVQWKKISGVTRYGVWRSETQEGPYTLVANTISTLYTDTKVTAGKTYYYRVTSVDAGGAHSETSETVSITFVTAPKIVSATSGAYVHWNAIDGAQKYGVWRSANGADGTYTLLGTTSYLYYTDRNAQSGVTYYYSITIVNADGSHTARSKPINCTFLSAPNIRSRLNVTTGVQLTWTQVPGALGYAVYRKSYGSDTWSRVGTVQGNGTLTWTDTSVRSKNGQAYYYTVRALAGSKLTILSAQRAFAPLIVRLTNPTLSYATKVSPTAIKCGWTASSVVMGYEIRLMNGNCIYHTYRVTGNNNVEKALTGLKKGRTYTVQVRSYTALDGVGPFYSTWSNARTVTLPAT